MNKKYQNLFIEENYREAMREYELMLSGAEVPRWDYVAITASSDAQASRYREELSYRLERGLIPAKTKYIVVADPDGKRVGSGGACLNVLREIAEREEGRATEGKLLFEGLRILCIHSGGDSKRVPQYSVCGKLFAPMPRRLGNGTPSTLFDEIMLTVSAFPSKMSDGMLTCSGDVLLLFDPQKMEYFSGGAAAISIKADAKTGSAHGVYLSDGEGRVRRFLHKQSVEALTSCGAVDGNGQVDIDTGAVLFDSEILRRLYSLVDNEEKLNKVVSDRVRLSFYADFSYPLSIEATLGEYFREKPEGEFTPELEGCREVIWGLLSDVNMRLTVFSPARFLHFGTTAELRALMTEALPSYCRNVWRRFINTDLLFPERAEENVSVNGGVIAKDAVIRRGSYIEDSYIGDAEIGEGCVISTSVVPDGAVIPRDTVVSTVETDDGFVARIYGVYDDPKECFHFGKPVSEPLWSARLFPVCDTPESAVSASLSVLFGDGGEYRGRLVSMEESFYGACSEGLSPLRERMLFRNAAKSFACLADEGAPIDRVWRIFDGLDADGRKRVSDVLVDFTADVESVAPHMIWQSMRMNAYLYCITNEDRYLDAFFAYLRDIILEGEAAELYGLIPVCEEKSVSLPVRVNLGGGWTDTPPYCMEKGGAVLNAAVILGDKLPINARVRYISERKLVFICEESGEREEICAESLPELISKCKPMEPFAIHKAALFACGLLHDGGDGRTLFDIIDGGLELSTAVLGIPKGSGLGTSSILSGALISSLYSLFGVSAPDNVIWSRVTAAEQYMGTGGGWQDQVGGMTPGIKMITSEPGVMQNVTVEPLGISEEAIRELEERFALIYTGQRREARKILRAVVWRCAVGYDRADLTVHGMGNLAWFMKRHLENGDIDAFAEALNRAYRYTEQLYRGCFNSCTDEIFRVVDDLICGKMICGAGGGGYLQVVLKKGVSVEELQSRLADVLGECEIRAQKCRFVRDLPR